MAKYIKKWVSNCQVCIQTKRINNDLLRTELLNCPEWDLGPEDILQMDNSPNPPPQAEAMIASLQQRCQELSWIYYASTLTFLQR